MMERLKRPRCEICGRKMKFFKQGDIKFWYCPEDDNLINI